MKRIVLTLAILISFFTAKSQIATIDSFWIYSIRYNPSNFVQDTVFVKRSDANGFGDTLWYRTETTLWIFYPTTDVSYFRAFAVGGRNSAGNFSVQAPTVSYPTRSLNSNFTISNQGWAQVNYTVTCNVTNPLLIGSSTATVFLEYSMNGSTWTGPVQSGNSSSVGVAVAIQLTNGQTGTLTSHYIPKGALVRLRTTTTGTATVTFVKAEESVNLN